MIDNASWTELSTKAQLAEIGQEEEDALLWSDDDDDDESPDNTRRTGRKSLLIDSRVWLLRTSFFSTVINIVKKVP